VLELTVLLAEIGSVFPLGRKNNPANETPPFIGKITYADSMQQWLGMQRVGSYTQRACEVNAVLAHAPASLSANQLEFHASSAMRILRIAARIGTLGALCINFLLNLDAYGSF
jgi:hypothetical protein